MAKKVPQTDEEFEELFRENLPTVPVPAKVAEEIKEKVLEEVKKTIPEKKEETTE